MATFTKKPLRNPPSLQLVQKKNRPEKFPFIAANKLNCVSCPKVSKIFFCSEFPVIPKEWWRKEEERQLRSVLLFKRMQKVKAEIRLPWQNFAKLLSCNSWPPYFSMALIWRCLLKDFSLTMWRFFKGSPNSK